MAGSPTRPGLLNQARKVHRNVFASRDDYRVPAIQQTEGSCRVRVLRVTPFIGHRPHFQFVPKTFILAEYVCLVVGNVPVS